MGGDDLTTQQPEETKIADLKEVPPAEKPKVFTYEGIIHLERLFDEKKLEKLKSKQKFRIPLLAISTDAKERELVIFSYNTPEDFEKGHCLIAGSSKELVQAIFNLFKEATE